MSELSDLSINEVEAKLHAVKRTRLIVSVIFGLIILAWIVLGYWRDNTPAFIATIALAGGILAMQTNSQQQLTKELEKRKNG